MMNERLTPEQMEQKYPDEWLFIVDCEHSEDTELLSGRVLVHNKSREDIYDASSRYKGSAAIRYIGGMRKDVVYILCQIQSDNWGFAQRAAWIPRNLSLCVN